MDYLIAEDDKVQQFQLIKDLSMSMEKSQHTIKNDFADL